MFNSTNELSFEDANNEGNLASYLIELKRRLEFIGKKIEILIENGDGLPKIFSLDESGHANARARAIDIYDSRRRRAKLFGPDLFGEPAWDILLDLFIAAETGKQISVTSACIGAAVPLTTALRWLSMLEARGLILRESDAKDARRSYVRLSNRGRELMEQYLLDY